MPSMGVAVGVPAAGLPKKLQARHKKPFRMQPIPTNIRAPAIILVQFMDHVIPVRLTYLFFIRGDIDASPDHGVIRAFYSPDLCAWINDSRSIES